MGLAVFWPVVGLFIELVLVRMGGMKVEVTGDCESEPLFDNYINLLTTFFPVSAIESMLLILSLTVDEFSVSTVLTSLASFIVLSFIVLLMFCVELGTTVIIAPTVVF